MARSASGKLAQVTGKDVAIDPADHYDAWAPTYEADLLGNYGYCAHRIAAAGFRELVPDPDAEIIDVGCGTGLVGLELAALGYARIDGVDISSGMLAKAAETGVYRRLIHLDAEKGQAPARDAYDGVICVGSFGLGHLGPEAFPNLIGMAKPGAPIAIFMNAEPFADEDYTSHIARLETQGLWSVLRIEDHNYMGALDRPGKLILTQRSRQ